MWLVGVGGIYGCGCKDVYRFPHIAYPYSSCIYLLFFAAVSPTSPTFCSFKKIKKCIYIDTGTLISLEELSLLVIIELLSKSAVF